MKIYKFGGASVKDASGVQNVARIISAGNPAQLLVVISAMGKTTNALESLVDACFHKKKTLHEILSVLRQSHQTIINDLFGETALMWVNEVENLFLELECLVDNENLQDDYDFLYDQVVIYGELISTRIVSAYLLSQGIRNQWVDSRNFILTNDRYRDARVDWTDTERVVTNRLLPLAQKNLIITQGFMGKGPKGESTTLGREGSDYSAAIFGKLLHAESVTIWKDVEGVMNADPKKFPDTQKIDHLTYNDAIELAYYGASVIHPKTIQPLKASNIPLFVKSFLNIDLPGTMVSDSGQPINVPCKILKENQLMLCISTKDFNFIAEDNLREIFAVFSENKIRVNIMQNSAIQLRCVIDNKENRHQPLLQALSNSNLDIEVIEGLKLLTVYKPTENEKDAANIHGLGQILLQQNTGSAMHYVLQ
jgi:aspartate kinase